jgi:hypothetical protein
VQSSFFAEQHREWGTREAIESLNVAEIVEESATPVDEAVLTNGLTELEFDPRSK